jgi:hypothetical protein
MRILKFKAFLKAKAIKDNFTAKGLKEAQEILKEDNLPEDEISSYKRYLEDLHYQASKAWSMQIEAAEFLKKKTIAPFLSKRGVTYTVLLGGEEAAKDYHISGYPTMYLVDKNGKIIYINVGYGKDVDNELDNIIQNNL